MSINWDKVANIFADHEEAETRRRKREIEGEFFNGGTGQFLDELFRSLPKMIEDHLEKDRFNLTPTVGWMPIFVCRPRHEAESVWIMAKLEAQLSSMDIRTMINGSGSNPGRDEVLMVNLEDLKTQARKHINRPPPELGAKRK
jgi:hypothetical protein